MKAPALISAVSLFLIPAALAAQTVDTTATPISLTEAIRLAQQNSVTSVQARGSVRTSDAAVKQSYAAFLPTFSVSAGTNHQSGDRFDTQGNLVPFTGNPTNYSTGLSSSLQLFDGGRRFFDVKRTKADVDAAEAGETASKYQVALQVKQQYYNILAARESQSAAQAQIDQAQQQLRVVVTASARRCRNGFRFTSLGCRTRQCAALTAHGREQSAGCECNADAAHRFATDSYRDAVRHARSAGHDSRYRRAHATRRSRARYQAGRRSARIGTCKPEIGEDCVPADGEHELQPQRKRARSGVRNRRQALRIQPESQLQPQLPAVQQPEP